MNKHLFIISVILFLSLLIRVRGYGEPDAAGHPNYQERANHVFLNAARISPSQYKEVYMAGYSPSPASILGSTYPARPPVYLEPKLINAAYAHSNDMAVNGCFQHNSCDGTATFTRIGNYYSCSGTKGENIAAGYADPLDTNNQWLCDSVGSACAADGSGNDGHRSNIMGSGYKVVGNGYAYSASATYKHYWTQDFGGTPCAPAPTSPIYGGSHRVKSGTTRFIAVYYTSPAVAPSSATVTIDGTTSNLALDIGAAGAGTYFLSQTAGTACRSYFFTFGTYRYPETGCLVTYGEGTCTTSFSTTCPGGSTTAASTTSTATTAATTSATSATTSTATTAATSSTAATTTTTSATTATTNPPAATSSTAATTSSTAATTTTATTAATSSTAATTTSATSATTSTTKPPTTTTTAATSSTTRLPTTSTTSSATSTTGTTGSSGTYYLYTSTLQNSWTLQFNSGAAVTHAFVYSGQGSLKAALASSGSGNFFMFNHVPTVTNVWTTLKFNIAGSTSGSIKVYLNGGFVQTKTFTTSWQAISIPLSSIGVSANTQLGSPKQIVFQNGGSTASTVYLNNVALV